MFSKLFGKKKKQEDKKQDDKKASKIEQKIQQKQVDQSQSQNREVLDQEYEWVYDHVLQYLISPIWKNQIYSFVDEYCIKFKDSEENDFEYTQIHKKFIEIVDGMLENFISEIGVDGEIFQKVLKYGLSVREHQKVFEQVLVIDNFMVFKAMMLKRNKELDLEALKQLEMCEGGINKLEIQSEQAQLDYAIEMSKAVEMQRQQLMAQEDIELQKAMAQSMVSYKQEQDKVEQIERQQTQQIQYMIDQEEQLKKFSQNVKQEDNQIVKQEDNQIVKQEDNQNVKQEDNKQQGKKQQGDTKQGDDRQEMQQDDEVQQIAESVYMKGEVVQKKEKIGSLAPLKQKSSLDPLTMDEMINKRENLLKQLDKLNNEEEKKMGKKMDEKCDEQFVDQKKQEEEDMRERKRRLQAQRDLILKKKDAERKEQTQEYCKRQNNQLENVSINKKVSLTDLRDAPRIQVNVKNIYKQEEKQTEQEREKQIENSKVTDEEMQRRKNIMEKIKKQI